MSQTTGEASGAPQANLMQLITGFMPARIVHLAAQLGLADPGSIPSTRGTGVASGRF